jgi:hypothetical protein
LEGVAILKEQGGATPAVVKARFVDHEVLRLQLVLGAQRLQGGGVLQGSLTHLDVAHVGVVARIEAYVIDRDFKLLENQVSHRDSDAAVVDPILLKLYGAQAVHSLPLGNAASTDGKLDAILNPIVLNEDPSESLFCMIVIFEEDLYTILAQRKLLLGVDDGP